MQPRLLKQTFYGFFFIAFIAAAAGLGVLIVKRSNQTVPQIEISKEKKIRITSFKEIKSSKSGILSDYIIEMENLSVKFGASAIKYSLGKTKGEDYLLPMEKKFAVVIGETRRLKEEEFIIENISWLEFSAKESAELIAQNKKYESESKDENGSMASASVLNKGKYDLKRIDIVVIISDFDEEPVAANFSQINVLLSGEEKIFKVFWPKQLKENIADIFIQASSNIMDKDNIKIF